MRVGYKDKSAFIFACAAEKMLRDAGISTYIYGTDDIRQRLYGDATDDTSDYALRSRAVLGPAPPACCRHYKRLPTQPTPSLP